MTHFPSTTPIPWGHLSPNPNFSSHTPSDRSLSSSAAYSTSSRLPSPRSPPDRLASPRASPRTLPRPRTPSPSTAGSPASGPEAGPRHAGQTPLLSPLTPALAGPRHPPTHIARSLRERGLRKTTCDPLVPPPLAAPGELECGVASRVPRGVGVQAGSPPRQLVPIVGAEGKEDPRDSPSACCQH